MVTRAANGPQSTAIQPQRLRTGPGDAVTPERAGRRQPGQEDADHYIGTKPKRIELAQAATRTATPPTPGTHPQPSPYLNRDPALRSIRDALNDASLSVAGRAQRALDYRNQELARVHPGAMKAMQGNDQAYPLYATGPHAGMHYPLYERLAGSQHMKQMMTDLSTRILAANQAQLDIRTIWRDTQAKARALLGTSANTRESNLTALQAMATLGNYYKFFPGGLPPELANGLPPGLWDKIHRAGQKLTYSTSPDAAVMSHGVPAMPRRGANFTADRNFHFFSHAYMTAALVERNGVRPNLAEAISGFAGAQYELMPESLCEGSGNSAVKDILVNGEGAAFGTSLLRNPDRALPATDDGPPPEDRSIQPLPSLPPEAQAISDSAQDLSFWGLVGSFLVGIAANKADQDRLFYEDTGIQPPTAGQYP